MVPAAMCRKAMVATLCAVVVCAYAVLAHVQVARAETDPLAQAAQSTQPADGAGGTQEGWSPGDRSGHAWSPDDWFADDWSGDGSPWDDWSPDTWSPGWSWDDWYQDGVPAQTPPDATPADTTPAEETPAEAAPADEASPADALPAAATTLAASVLDAPVLKASATTISWVPSIATSSYVFVRKVPGEAPQYSLVSGTSVAPPAVPGETVSYGVRANVQGSAWAPEVSITYPDAVQEPDPAPPTTPTVDLTAAPTLTVSGTTVKWSRVGSVATYVFVRKVQGQAAQYSLVSGTSATPPVVPGQTVSYGLRTNVSGSAWASEVSITYPSSSSPSPPSSPSQPSQPVNGSFQMGVVAGSALTYELSFLKSLGAHTARLDFGIGTSASSMASTIDQYARAGIRPLLLASFYGRVPSTAEAQNLASWAAAYGPGGTFWQGKSYPANTAVTDIEFGNETSYSYQFSDYSLSTYSSRAQTYAQRARDAANAIRSANSRVGLLAIGDNAVNQTAWVTNMLKAVPNLDDLLAGWTIHPYGPSWATRIDSTINSTKSAGARDLPVWITEWGISSDNGRCLSDNYGFDKCITYSAAATALHSALAGIQSRYGSRLGGFYLYQAHDQYASGTKTGRESYFGALQSNGATKGAYTTEVKAELAAN